MRSEWRSSDGARTASQPFSSQITELQFTSLAVGKRLRDAGLLGSMGTVGDCYDNSMMESFWGTM